MFTAATILIYTVSVMSAVRFVAAAVNHLRGRTTEHRLLTDAAILLHNLIILLILWVGAYYVWSSHRALGSSLTDDQRWLIASIIYLQIFDAGLITIAGAWSRRAWALVLSEFLPALWLGFILSPLWPRDALIVAVSIAGLAIAAVIYGRAHPGHSRAMWT